MKFNKEDLQDYPLDQKYCWKLKTYKYFIDKAAACTYSDLEVKDLEDELENVDVVVTVIFAFDEILNVIEDKFDCSIVSLEDVVYEI